MVDTIAAPRRPRALPVFAALAVVVFLAGLVGGGYQSKLSDVQKNDNAAFLPASAESTKVQTESLPFTPTTTIPGFVVYSRPGGLTAADKAKITGDAAKARAVHGIAAEQVLAPTFSADGTAAALSVPLVAKTGSTDSTGQQLVDAEKAVTAVARAGNPAGLIVHTAGAGGLLAAFIDSFGGLDGALLLSAGLVVIVLLLIVYRSPVLWFFPLFSAVLALGLSSIVIYALAKSGAITLNGQSQGILSVLVIGAGTDYALLLVSRYREELHVYPSRRDAMVKAWKGAAPAIAASAATVIIGLLCLLFSQLNSNRSLGPVSAIGIASTLVVMLFFLPVALVAAGRWIFWPRIPRAGTAPVIADGADAAEHAAVAGGRVWGRIAASVGSGDRKAWIGGTVVLVILAGLLTTLRAGGLSTEDSFTNTPDAVVGQKLYDATFAQGAGAPAVITTDAASATSVIAAARAVPGVAAGRGSVCLEPDYAAVGAAVRGGGTVTPGADGCLPAALSVKPIGGRTVVDATLASSFDSQAAYDTVGRLRTAVHAVPGASALVGGQSAINLDTQNASARDRNVIIPIVLLVILVVLGLLLRALLAPVLLIASVVLSFAATLGISAVFFNHVFHFANSDPGFPLFAFIFLVALGIDYNIFLMTRVREETLTVGTRAGVLRGLAVTGGVITSAGAVLASTFAVLGVLPLVFLAELGFSVAVGVLLDTLLVRSIIVPALAHDLGKVIWWPSRLARTAD